MDGDWCTDIEPTIMESIFCGEVSGSIYGHILYCDRRRAPQFLRNNVQQINDFIKMLGPLLLVLRDWECLPSKSKWPHEAEKIPEQIHGDDEKEGRGRAVAAFLTPECKPSTLAKLNNSLFHNHILHLCILVLAHTVPPHGKVFFLQG